MKISLEYPNSIFEPIITYESTVIPLEGEQIIIPMQAGSISGAYTVKKRLFIYHSDMIRLEVEKVPET